MKYVSNFKRKRGRCETSVVIKEGHLIIKLRVPRLEDDTIDFFPKIRLNKFVKLVKNFHH